jgi:alpha-L-rhamnosidase
MKSALREVRPTDCPASTQSHVQDYIDSQRANGGFTETAPFVGIADSGLGGDSGPIGWQAFVPVALTWQYKYYGNAQLLHETIGPALAQGRFINASSQQLIENGLGDW